MSVPYFGDYPEDETVYIPFNTFSSDDPQASVTITNLVDADLKVHKDGSATQIVTDGATITIDFDTITGNHLATIDTSAHADYATGSDYIVRMEGTTVDGGTINAWIGSFSIENRFKDVNVVTVSGTSQTGNDNGADINTILSRIVGTLAAGTHNPATAAQIAVLSDWINGGRLDLILDIIAADTTTDIPALIAALNDIAATDIVSSGAITTLAGAVANVDLVDTTTANTDMRGTDGANTTVPDAAGVAPTAVENRQEMDANSVDLNSILTNQTTIAGLITALNDLSAAQVNAEVVDVMKTDTIAEMAQQAPPTTPTFEEAVMYLYMALVHKGDVTATLKEFHNNAGAVIWKKTLSDDGTTYSEADGASGP